MASEDLLKKAVAAFKALSPEQQAEMLEEQRQSWVRGNIGLSRDERGMTSPMMRALKTVREENSVGRQAVKVWADSKTRPTPVAPVSPDATGKCGELETVEHQYWRDQTQEWLPTGFPDRYRKDGFSVRELVTRSQALELLAAERAEKDEWRKRYHATHERLLEADEKLHALEADNAALTARVKELEAERTMIVSHATMGGTNGIGLSVNEISVCVTALRNKLYNEGKKQTEALETKLAAANKALTVADEALQADAIASAHAAIRAVLGGKPS